MSLLDWVVFGIVFALTNLAVTLFIRSLTAKQKPTS